MHQEPKRNHPGGGHLILKGFPEDRAAVFARYIIETGATVREAAKQFHISKSTVQKDI